MGKIFLCFDRSFNINKTELNAWYKNSVLHNSEIKGVLRTDITSCNMHIIVKNRIVVTT